MPRQKRQETLGSKVANIAKSAGLELGAVTEGLAAVNSLVVDAKQLNPQPSSIELSEDVYGGLAIPEINFSEHIPSDLINPNISTTATEEQLISGLENYAAGTRAQKLYQEGLKYIGEVGKTKQLYHRAQQSVIKGATEGIKVQQEIVRFNRQNVELQIDSEKLVQSQEKLSQETVKTLGLEKETEQLRLRIEAQEAKRDAEISRIKYQTSKIVEKYLTE